MILGMSEDQRDNLLKNSQYTETLIEEGGSLNWLTGLAFFAKFRGELNASMVDKEDELTPTATKTYLHQVSEIAKV